MSKVGRPMEKKPGKGVMILHSEEQAYPRRENTEARRPRDSSRRQAERGGKAFWDAD